AKEATTLSDTRSTSPPSRATDQGLPGWGGGRSFSILIVVEVVGAHVNALGHWGRGRRRGGGDLLGGPAGGPGGHLPLVGEELEGILPDLLLHVVAEFGIIPEELLGRVLPLADALLA